MIRVALAGAGVMGANHARLLSSIPECELVAVVEQDDVRGQAVAAMAGTKHLTSFDELPDDVQAVVIATPTATHEKLGIQLLGRGIDLLIEKPIASNAVEARRLLEAVEGTDQILMVGHIERFNPAFIELQRFLDEPLHLEFTRVGPYSPRVGIDVVLDLMIHDLDLALTMADSQVASMSATGRVIMGDTLDLASALLVFESGLTATLTASRVAQIKVRKIDVTQRTSFASADLVRQDVTINRLSHSEFLAEGVPVYRQSGLVEIPFVEQRGEPLG
ncbi:MAG TPA: Gfo/Idh/MocA family oxidoreductase, partial [Acidimicrobiales bacterium]